MASRVGICILFLISLTIAQSADGVIGCGGFVEYAPDIANIITKQIDYSVIQIKLLTSEGVVKETTECAPNGYYFIPIERKGNYIIQIEGPSGWTFDPKEVPVQIGSDNVCRPQKGGSGEDINFYFTGFTISGRAVGKNCPEVRSSSGRTRGPRGVGITLESLEKSEIPKRYTETDASGMYFFSNVFPGRYSLTASHPTLHLAQNRAEVMMEWDNLVVSSDFVVSGYDVSGTVNSGSDPVSNVDFVLYHPNALKIEGCQLGSFTAPKDNLHPICTAKSNAKGDFYFKSIPCGNYTLIPHYNGNNTSFDVSPSRVPVSITLDSVVISQPFRVVGFSVAGRVVTSEGEGMSQVSIQVEGADKTVTGGDGSFILDQMTSGTYRIQASKPHYYFEEKSIRVVPNVPVPNISPSYYDICGSILTNNGTNKRTGTIILKDESNKEVQRETFEGTDFCFKRIKPGVWFLEPVITAAERSNGLILTPSSHRVVVSSAPISGITFSQSRLTLGGKVVCLNGNCPPTTSLKLVDNEKKETTTFPDNGVFMFKDVVPGTYKLYVNSDQPLCWDNSYKEIEVKTQNLTGIDFNQNGYLVNVDTKHSLDVVVSQGSQVSTFSLDHPSDTFCLPKAGVYDIRPLSCFQFERDIFTYDTASPRTITLVPQKYKVIGHIRVNGPAPDLKVNLKVTNGKNVKDVTVTPSETGNDIYEYSYWATLQDEIVASPSAKNLLFYPNTRTVHVTRDECPPPVPSIDGRPAIFKKGKVTPAVEGIRIVAVKSDGSEAVETTTDKNGEYNLGPLYDTFQYSVKAEKLGYNLEQSGTSGNFEAFKLSHVTVSVAEGSTPVSGVLISMSGVSFRSNNVTSSSGKFTFYGLKPGKYFARPLLKEYSFEPSSQTVEVVDGKDADVIFKAKRNAFSCYGNLSTLTGDVISHAVVEAVGPNGEYEEAESDQFGRYRIRGLLPGVKYTVRVKTSDHVDRTIPTSRTVQVENANSENVNFLVFHQIEHHSLTGVIETEGDWLSSLVVTLTGINDDTVIQRVSMGTSEYFRLSQLPKGKFNLKIHSTFPTDFYTLPVVQQVVTVHGDSAKDHLKLSWLPTHHSQDVSASHGSPIFGFLFGLVLLYCAFNFKTVRSLVDSIRKGSLLERSAPTSQGGQDWLPSQLRQSSKPKRK